MENNWYFLSNKGLVNNPSKEDLESESMSGIIKINVGANEDIIIENWWVLTGSTCIDYAFSISSVSKDPKGSAYLRRKFFEEKGVDPPFLRAITVPPSFFENNQRLLRYHYSYYC